MGLEESVWNVRENQSKKEEEREKNAYNFSSNEEFKVYMLWSSPNGEGYMFNKDTNELGQLNPPELCKFIGSKRHFKLSN